MDKNNAADTATNLANHIRVLKTECGRLKHQLSLGKQTADLVTLWPNLTIFFGQFLAKCEHERKMAEFVKEEKEIKEENLRLQRRLQLEMERREALCR